MRADVLVIGCGAAGVAAARAAREVGARVAVVHQTPGATALGSGVVWGAARDPFAAWASEGPWRLGGRYVTTAGWVVTDALGALTSLLDLAALAPEKPVGVLALDTHPSWSPWLLANTLGGRVIHAKEMPSAQTFRELAMGLDTEGIADGIGVNLRAACEGLSGLLLPPVLGLRRLDVAERISRAAGVTVGEAAGMPGDPTGFRTDLAVRNWLPDDVTVHPGTARVTAGERATVTVEGLGDITVRSVVLATGGLAGGGLVFDDGLREVTARGTVWVQGRTRVPDRPGSLRGFDPMEWFDDSTEKALNSGLRTDVLQRVLGPEAEGPWCRWLFAAGDVAPGRHGDGLAGALRSGSLAGREAARFALG